MSAHRLSKLYLGDSVYIEHVPGFLKLTTENGMGPTNTIYLEAEVIDAFIAYYHALCDLPLGTPPPEPEEDA